MKRLDSVIAALFPQVELRRARARAQLDTLSKVRDRGFEAASRGRRTSGWTTPDSSAAAESRGVVSVLRARSRDLVRNNGWVKKGIGGIVSNTVGTGIVPQFSVGGGARRSEQIRIAWRKWADSVDCDFDGLHDFSGLQALAMRTLAEAGEVLIRKRPLSSKDTKAIPLQLQVLEPDFIDSTKDGTSNLVQGVEFDSEGRRVAYWLYSQHPGGSTSGVSSMKSQRVPASEIIHLFRVDRPGQVRGIPWTVPIIVTVRDLDEYEDAELIRRKVAACFAGFVVENEAPDLGTSSGSISEKLEPGMIEILPPGKDIRFGTPPSVAAADEFTILMLRKVSAGLEVPYEVLTGDYSRVNFSSGRMGWIEFQRNIELWRWQILVPRLCNPAANWFLEALSFTGVRTEDAYAEWTAPRREMIDPVKEGNAMLTQVRAGFMSLPEAIRQLGFDPTLMFEEIKKSNEQLDAMGIILDSDPRKMQKAGKAQDAVPADETPN